MKPFNILYRAKIKLSNTSSWEQHFWTDWEVLQYNVPANLVEERLTFWRNVNGSVVKQSNDIYKIREYKAEPAEET